MTRGSAVAGHVLLSNGAGVLVQPIGNADASVYTNRCGVLHTLSLGGNPQAEYKEDREYPCACQL